MFYMSGFLKTFYILLALSLPLHHLAQSVVTTAAALICLLLLEDLHFLMLLCLTLARLDASLPTKAVLSRIATCW
jgi:hypothetical protein